MQRRVACKYAVLLLLLVAVGFYGMPRNIPDYEALYGPAAPKQRLLDAEEAVRREASGYVSYWKDVQPILDRRCVVCHACYDAPCQLRLGSFEGVDRGATKQLLYDGRRMTPSAPTRLFIDAQETAGWRAKQFFPVLNERADSAAAAVDNSLLAKMLLMKQKYPSAAAGRLPDTFQFKLQRPLACPTIEEFAMF